MSLSYLLYDVFTNERLLGNQLAVFTDGSGVPSIQMQRIAREMNLSESTFILPRETEGTDVRMRIFTPLSEMPMAGHPTIGSTFALAHTGVIKARSPRVVFELNIGAVPVDLQWSDGDLRFAWMTQSRPTFGPAVEARAAVAEAIGLSDDDLVPELPIQQVSCGVPFLFVPVRDPETVDRATSDAGAFRRLATSEGINLPIFFFARSPATAKETVYSRMFAPDFGIVEDPATGSASGPLGCYLVHHGMIEPAEAARIVSAQGVAMGRPSVIHIAISGTREAITEVKVGGEAVLTGRGELLL